MAAIRVALEIGSKRIFASALEWPGWSRQGKTAEQALDALEAYAPRYAKVASRARVKLPAKLELEVIERLKGDATTDFGAPGAAAKFEREPMTKAVIDQMADLVEACWAELDAVVSAAPASLRKGPRGGGRDRDKIVDHVLGAECGYSRKLDLKLSQPAVDDRKGIAAHRKTIVGVLRAGTPTGEGRWPLRYLARRIAWHALDHAWEIEDRTER